MTAAQPTTAPEVLSRAQLDAVRAEGSLTTFLYKPNSRGFVFLQICAALLIFIGFWVFVGTIARYWLVLVFALGAVAVWLLGLVVFWSYFAKHSLVAFDDDALYVVRPRTVHRVPWLCINAQTAGFSEEDSKDHGVLNMDFDGQQVELCLFNPFVWVDDFPTFLVELLMRVKENTPDVPEDKPDNAESVDNANDCA